MLPAPAGSAAPTQITASKTAPAPISNWLPVSGCQDQDCRDQKHQQREADAYARRLWGSNGDMPISRPVPCLPGVFKHGNPQNRIHLTEKPLQLMRDIVKITEPGGYILDPFAGSGATVLAVVPEEYSATGIEVAGEYARLSRERIERELAQAA